MICVAWVGMGSYAQCALFQFIKDTDESVIDTPKSWFFGLYDGDFCM